MSGESDEFEEPADVTSGDMSYEDDSDIFGYDEPTDEPADEPSQSDDLEYFEDTYFEEPADVTPGDMYESMSEGAGSSQSDEFENEFQMPRRLMKQLSRNYGCEWEKEGNTWVMYDTDEHVFTYDPTEGVLYTDFDLDQVKGMVYDDPRSMSEGTVDPKELMDPESEYYLGDENDEIMPDLDSIGGVRNPDNPYVDMEDTLGKDTADFMRKYNNSPKQRMHKYLFDTHEWSEDDDQSDWDDKIEYFYGDLHDKFGDEDDWDDETAYDVASTHMYGHPRWDEETYGAELKRALVLYETAQQATELLSRMQEEDEVEQLYSVRIRHNYHRSGSTYDYTGRRFGTPILAHSEEEAKDIVRQHRDEIESMLRQKRAPNGRRLIMKSDKYTFKDKDVVNAEPITKKHWYNPGAVEVLTRDGFQTIDAREYMQEARHTSIETRMTEITGASYARDYLAQLDDPTDASYEDYAVWLEDQGAPEQLISKVWFKTNKKRHISKLGDTPKKSKAEPAEATFTSADQKKVEEIIRRSGYQLETMWGEDNPVSLRQSKTRDGRKLSVMDAYIETGDRGPRMDHGGEGGDGWMGSDEIAREFKPYGDKWQPKAKKLEERLQAAGYPNAKVSVDFGEKGHIGLNVWITSDPLNHQAEKARRNTSARKRRQRESTRFSSMSSSAQGSTEDDEDTFPLDDFLELTPKHSKKHKGSDSRDITWDQLGLARDEDEDDVPLFWDESMREDRGNMVYAWGGSPNGRGRRSTKTDDVPVEIGMQGRVQNKDISAAEDEDENDDEEDRSIHSFSHG